MIKDGGASARQLAVNKTQASAMLGVSVDFFEEHIEREVRSVRRGRRRLFPVRELEAWLDRHAELIGGGS